MEKLFKLKEHGTSVRIEIIAGLTTFASMAYILFVNSGMFAELEGVTYNAVYIATAISAVIGTLLIGLLANLPLAQATGMGLNAFFVYTVCFGLGFTYANALIFVLADGVLFIILTATGLRKAIFESVPRTIKTAIPAGIGLFIAFIGLQDSGLVIADASTGVTLSSFNVLGSATWATIMPMAVTLVTLMIIAALCKNEVRGAVLWGILIGAVLYYLLGLTVPGFYAEFSMGNMNPMVAFKEWGQFSFGKVFTDGFDFSGYLATHSSGSLVITFITTALAFCMVDMFDTMGTLFGACKTGDMLILNEEGEEEVPNMEKAMLSDAIATCTGAICGTSTVTTFVEASSGVAAGGRTGFAAVVTAAMFFISMFLSPIASLIPASAYAAALIYVGILMIGCVRDIDWRNPSIALPSFLTITMMPFTYNISYGIAFGLTSYLVVRTLTHDIKKIRPGTWVISALFIAMFLLTH